MQAAFVDIGLPKAGFLHVSDILVDPHTPPWGNETAPARLGHLAGRGSAPTCLAPEPAYAIEELLEEGQELLVQVAKEPLGTKGCRLTTYLSLAGRYLVLMPGVEHIGVSRRIPDEAEKERLRAASKRSFQRVWAVLCARSAPGSRSQELQADLHFLTALWQHVQHTARQVSAPAWCIKKLTSSCGRCVIF